MISAKTKVNKDATYRTSETGQRALVFVHGFLDGAEVWDDDVREFEISWVERIRVDLAGMGDRANDEGQHTLDRFAADIATVIEAIDKPVVPIGQRMGAQAAELD